MSYNYQNALYLQHATDGRGGALFSRWLAEWTTYVIGMTQVQSSSAPWNRCIASGTGGYTKSDPHLFGIPASEYSFSSDDDNYLTIWGFSDSTKDGVYRLINHTGSVQTASLDTPNGVHANGLPLNESGLSWRLWGRTTTYAPAATDWMVIRGSGSVNGEYEFKLTVSANGSGNSNYPTIEFSPWTTWSTGSQAWSDNRNTTAKDHNTSNVNNNQICRVFSCGDKEAIRVWIYFDDEQMGRILYLGESTPNYPDDDTKPIVLGYGGCNRLVTQGQFEFGRLFGHGYSGDGINCFRWLSSDDETTVTGYVTFPHNLYGSEDNRTENDQRKRSEWSSEYYLIDMQLRSITAGYFELRGTPKDMWICGSYNPVLSPFGLNNQYLHLQGGLSFPWNGSPVAFEISYP